MDKETQILYDALQKIAQGTLDTEFPFRCAPREILKNYARDVLIHFEADRKIEDDDFPF